MDFASRVGGEVCESHKTILEDLSFEVLTHYYALSVPFRSNHSFRAKRGHHFPECHNRQLASSRRGKFFSYCARRVDQRSR
jgi:hypothetical protein